MDEIKKYELEDIKHLIDWESTSKIYNHNERKILEIDCKIQAIAMLQFNKEFDRLKDETFKD